MYVRMYIYIYMFMCVSIGTKLSVCWRVSKLKRIWMDFLLTHMFECIDKILIRIISILI